MKIASTNKKIISFKDNFDNGIGNKRIPLSEYNKIKQGTHEILSKKNKTVLFDRNIYPSENTLKLKDVINAIKSISKKVANKLKLHK